MNYSNHILDYSKYNYICLPKAGSQPTFRWLVVHSYILIFYTNKALKF